MTTTTEFQLVDINKLVPYANNARTHNKEQILKLRSSLREFGFVNPVIIDREYNVLAGHGRIMAAKEEGIAEVPCVYADHLTDAQKKAYILADNRMALDAGWDEELLAVEMEELQNLGFDLGLTGFDEKEIADLFAIDSDEAKEDNFDVDAELEKPCKSKLGDIWHLGKHTVICGDSTLPETFNALLGDTRVNLVCTDAPYFVDLNSSSGKIKNDSLNDVILTLIRLFEKQGVEWRDEMPLNMTAPYGFKEGESTDKLISKLKLAHYATAKNCLDAAIEKYDLKNYTPDEQRKIAGVRYGMLFGCLMVVTCV